MTLAPQAQAAVARLKTDFGFSVLMQLLERDCKQREESLAVAKNPEEVLARHAQWAARREVYQLLSSSPEFFVNQLSENGYVFDGVNLTEKEG